MQGAGRRTLRVLCRIAFNRFPGNIIWMPMKWCNFVTARESYNNPGCPDIAKLLIC